MGTSGACTASLLKVHGKSLRPPLAGEPTGNASRWQAASEFMTGEVGRQRAAAACAIYTFRDCEQPAGRGRSAGVLFCSLHRHGSLARIRLRYTASMTHPQRRALTSGGRPVASIASRDRVQPQPFQHWFPAPPRLRRDDVISAGYDGLLAGLQEARQIHQD